MSRQIIVTCDHCGTTTDAPVEWFGVRVYLHGDTKTGYAALASKFIVPSPANEHDFCSLDHAEMWMKEQGIEGGNDET